MDILNQIRDLDTLQRLSMDELEQLADALRHRIIEVVNKNGGHLASPLGVVDLTVALHHVYDQLIWDVGHQCYAHKLLSGRADQFETIRKQHGLSGYPKVSESDADCFGTGHSSTSISAAVGMAIARDLRGEDHQVIALIGDGAITGGMALEALSHAGHLGLNMLVILNDNEMSISRNDGAMSKYFNRMITAAPYKRAKEDAGSFVKKLIGDRMTKTIQDIEKSVKGFITNGALFQELGVNYIGPVDGHDLPLLIECLERLKRFNGPILLHCRTEKGKGLPQAEEDPLKYHGIGPMGVYKIDAEGDGLPAKVEASKPHVTTFTDAFANAMIAAGEKDDRVIGITAAMPTGTGLSKFGEKFPNRFFDVGICEQHAVTFAAGLAIRGMKPVAAIYSTFLQRGYDQLIHDVCIQNLPVVFAIDRAGLVGEDSPTQNGTFDISFLRAVPNMKVAAPRDAIDTALMLDWALAQDTPVAVRYARDKAPAIGNPEGRDVSRAETLREGGDVCFLCIGPCCAQAMEAAARLEEEGIAAGVIDARHVKPLDTDMLDTIANQPILTVEENTLDGGFGSAVLEYFANQGRLDGLRIHRMGVPDVFSEHATRAEQLANHDLDAEGLAKATRTLLGAFVSPAVK